jgi:hypothetical protein
MKRGCGVALVMRLKKSIRKESAETSRTRKGRVKRRSNNSETRKMECEENGVRERK